MLPVLMDRVKTDTIKKNIYILSRFVGEVIITDTEQNWNLKMFRNINLH